MLIPCPNCGPRDVEEFSYLGDATVKRPKESDLRQEAWNAYVYDRANPRGPHTEYWQHAHGCRHILIVERDTATHAVHGARLAGGWDKAPKAKTGKGGAK